MKTIKIILIVILLTKIGFSQENEDSPFGFHPAIVVPPFEYGISNPYDFAVDLGIKWDRSLSFIWTLIQPDTAVYVYDWTKYDQQQHDAPSSICFLANICIGNPAEDSLATARMQPGSFLPVDSMAYIQYVKAVVERYDGDSIDDMPGLTIPVKYWQVDNEPPHGLSGYSQFLQMTYLAIKEADSTAKVLIGGVPGIPPVPDYLQNFDAFYLPILQELNGEYIDIFDFHWFGEATGDYKGAKEVYDHILQELIGNGFNPEMEFWITEMGTYSGDPAPIPVLGNYDYPFQTEKQQAADLVKRHVYSLSVGIKKVFMAFGLKEGFKYDQGYFDFTGLIYDGIFEDTLWKGEKKLGYYTYKLMTEKLEGSNWDSIQTLIDGTNDIYAYKFIKTGTDEPVYVAWWDYFNDSTYMEGDTQQVTITGITDDNTIVTNSVPDDTSGINITDYNTAFIVDTLAVSNNSVIITLRETPLFIEMPSMPASVDEKKSINPGDFQLNSYPNPFNATTTISYYLPQKAFVSLIIYDALGREIKTLVNMKQAVGNYSVIWNGNNNLGNPVDTGIYVCEVKIENDVIQIRKLLFLK